MKNWPLPPFYKDASTNEELTPLDAMFLDKAGVAVKGHLLRFSPESGTFAFAGTNDAAVATLQLSTLKSLHLSAPIHLVPDRELMAIYDDAGGQVTEPTARPFELSFMNGEILHGDTHGFVRTQQGLFLYLVTHDAWSIRVFVPDFAVSQLKVGTLLGKLLVDSGTVSRAHVDQALDTQAQQGRAMLEEHVGDAPVTDSKSLAAMVDHHGALPAQIRVTDILVHQGLASRDQLFEALGRLSKDKRKPLGHILAEMGVLTEAQLARAVASQLGVPIVALENFAIKPAVIGMIDSAFAVAHQVLPLLATDRILVVAVENPVNVPYLDELRFSTEREVIPVIASSKELATRIAVEYSSKAVAGKAAGIKREIDELGLSLTREAATSAGSPQTRQVKDTDTLLVRLVNNMIIYAHEQGASDIHVEAYPDGTPTRIRFRIDGLLSDYLQLPSTLRSALISRLKIMADLDISEHRKPQDGKIDFQRFAALKLELRVASLPTANGLEDVVMRLLSSSKPIALSELGISRELATQLKAMAHRSFGLILVCGPTGSGKTTTLHSLLAEVNTAENKIWTAEDPIEITHPGLRQIQMIPRAGLTFAIAMRAFLRADPDIIMVGEMRDEETSRIAIEASLTGHLVLSTLHTNSAPESVVRLLELGLDPFNFADALIGVLSQRLARRLCVECKVATENPEGELQQLVEEYCNDTQLDGTVVLEEWRQRFGSPRGSNPVLYRPAGCERCHQTGFRGRVGVYELMTATPKIKRLIQARSPVDSMFVQAVADGMLRLKQYGIHTVLQGFTDIHSIHSACV